MYVIIRDFNGVRYYAAGGGTWSTFATFAKKYSTWSMAKGVVKRMVVGDECKVMLAGMATDEAKAIAMVKGTTLI